MIPEQKLSAIESEPALKRLHYCRILLALNGFLSERENKQAKIRLEKWAARFLNAKRAK